MNPSVRSTPIKQRAIKRFAQLVTPILLACVVLFGLNACQDDASQRPLSISGPFEPINLEPASSGYVFTRMQVIETLLNVDEQGHITPGLATAWQHDDDYRVWTLTLRHGVSFHNGQPLTAEAVIKSLRAAFAKPAPYTWDLVKSYEAPSADTVVLTLRKRYRPFAAILTHYTTAILAPDSYDTEQNVTQLLGTGSYQLTDFQPPHAASAKRFTDYWGQPASIEAVDYVTGHRSESRALMVKSGQTDIVYNLDPASVDLLKHAANVKVDTTLIPRTILIKLNAEHVALADQRVRQALSLAIDRQGIAENILRAPGTEANQLFGPSFQRWHRPELAPIQRDLSRAKRLLDDAGWQQQQDGLRYKDGQPLALNMMTYANRPELMVIATAIQDQWRELGVDLQVSMENASAIPMAHVRGNLQTALIARNLGLLPDPLALLAKEFSDPQGGDWGPMNWHNTQVFDWVEQLERSQNEAQSTQLIQQITAAINDDLPLIPVVYYVQQTGVSTRLEGFHFDPYERSFNLNSLTLTHD